MESEQENFATKGAASYLIKRGTPFTPGTLNTWRCLGKARGELEWIETSVPAKSVQCEVAKKDCPLKSADHKS
jgi:hypothetical protein